MSAYLPMIFPESVGLSGISGFLDRLFDASREALSSGKLFSVRADLCEQPFLFASSLKDRIELIRSRVNITTAKAKGTPESLLSLSADELGWQVPRWTETDWLKPQYDECLARAGYEAEYPYFDRDWTVRRKSDGFGIHIVPSWNSLRPWDQGAPLRVLFNFAFRQNGCLLLHAGSIGRDGHAALLSGVGGSGKSGTVLAGLAHGLESVGDDYILLDPRDGYRVRRIFRIIKQAPDGLSRIPGLAVRVGERPLNWQGKVEFDPSEIFPAAMVNDQKVAAILFPRIEKASKCLLAPVERRQAATRLVRGMENEFAGETVARLLAMTRLTAKVPAHELRLSPDPAEVASIIDELLRRTRMAS